MFALLQLFLAARLRLVVRHEVGNPLAVVLRDAAIGRVAHDDHHGAVALDGVRGVCLCAEEDVEERTAQVLRLFKRIGKKDVEAFVCVVFIAGVGENAVELDVRHRVGGHQKFKAVETRNEVFGDVAGPLALVGEELAVDAVDALREERPRSCRRVENLDFRHGLFDLLRQGLSRVAVLRHFNLHHIAAGYTVSDAESFHKNVVDGTDDEAHHGKRRVPYASILAQSRVVGVEEVLVEVNHRVAALFGLSVVLHDAAHVSGGEETNDVIDGPLDFFLDVGIDVVEEFAQEWIGFRDKTRRLFAREVLRRVVVETGGKHSVGERLRVDVGELVRVGAGHEYALEALHQFPERRTFGIAA